MINNPDEDTDIASKQQLIALRNTLQEEYKESQ